MSVNEIVKYVRQTPGNTNPSVVASMVNAEADNTLKAAKEYTDSQRLGYVEHKVLKFGGTLEDMTLISENDGMYVVKVSEEIIDLKEVKLVGAKFPWGSGFEEIREDNSQINTDVSYIIMAIQFGETYMPAMATVTNELLWDGVGTYFFGYDRKEVIGWMFQADIETIHQIPQEFFPVFDSIILNGLDEKKYRLYINESGEFATSEVV